MAKGSKFCMGVGLVRVKAPMYLLSGQGESEDSTQMANSEGSLACGQSKQRSRRRRCHTFLSSSGFGDVGVFFYVDIKPWIKDTRQLRAWQCPSLKCVVVRWNCRGVGAKVITG